MKKDKIIIFDTTLRDGEQSAGASMSIEDKVEIATKLNEMAFLCMYDVSLVRNRNCGLTKTCFMKLLESLHHCAYILLKP